MVHGKGGIINRFVFHYIVLTVPNTDFTGSLILFVFLLALRCGSSWPQRFMSGNVVTRELLSTCIEDICFCYI